MNFADLDSWSLQLGRMGEAAPEVASVFFPATSPVSVRSREFHAPKLETSGLAFSRTVQCGRIRIQTPTVKAESIHFGSTALDLRPLGPKKQAIPESSIHPSTLPFHRPVSTGRPVPPARVPLRDRLQALLQPPVEFLVEDYRVWLPFEPFAYQVEGINFLAGRWGALLADEMGLGKTMQTIMALRLLLRSGQIRSVLLVCPKPLVTNWLREFRLWAEEIPVAPIQGSLASRKHAWLHDRAAVKLANYESLSRDEALLEDHRLTFDLTVIDEAQRIKNRDSRTAKVVHALRRKRSWALTGTPVENHAGDLLSLLEFVDRDRWISDVRPEALREAVAGLILRRTKEMVLGDMPPKSIQDQYIDLGPAQRERYDLAEQDGVVQLNDLGDELTIEHVFDLIRRLKQICNYDPLTGESAKADQLQADLEEVVESGHKAILFSQWVGTIDWLEKRLAALHPLVYHGKVANRNRDGILKSFREDRKRSIILMSYGTGAVGLNLQEANYVFLFDRWWNPAVEDQAINRAHRIGQKKPVTVRRYIAPNTIEERIHDILTRKRELFAEIIDGHDPSESLGLSKAEIIGLFDLQVRGKSANT